MKYYWKYIKPYMLFFILGPLLMLTEVAGEIVLPKIMASMIDSGIGAEVAGLGTGYILSRALLMIACIGIMAVSAVISLRLGRRFISVRI